MIIVVIGAKGGLGTTTLVERLCRFGDCVALDAADGRLASLMAGPVRPALDLATTPQWTAGRRALMAEEVARIRQPLLWTAACEVWCEQVSAFVHAVSTIGLIIADGGIDPTTSLVRLADLLLIVSNDSAPARWHEARLKATWPEARAIVGDLPSAAQAITEQVLGVPPRRSLLHRARHILPEQAQIGNRK